MAPSITSRSDKSHRKVLLMGKSGSGKTSMRSIIFKSQLAADTRRLAATIDVENSQIKFLGGLKLDLWDCGGQDTFMDSHLTSQSSTVFRSVHSLIYIFDAESTELLTSDVHYFLKCLTALRHHSGYGSSSVVSPVLDSDSLSHDKESRLQVFVLLHKMDLVPQAQRVKKLTDFESDVTKRARESGWKGGLKFFGTSIWDETLYRAWSSIMAFLMPSLSSVRGHLMQLLETTSAKEVVLFERSTFLVISSVTDDEDTNPLWDDRRFERISTMVKAFKISCANIRTPFTSFTMTTPKYTAVLDSLTSETYILILSKPEILPATIETNIKLSRQYFIHLEAFVLGR